MSHCSSHCRNHSWCTGHFASSRECVGYSSICSGYFSAHCRCTSDLSHSPDGYEGYYSYHSCSGHSSLRPDNSSALNDTHPVSSNDIIQANQINNIYTQLLAEITIRQQHAWYESMSNFPTSLTYSKTLPITNRKLVYNDILNKLSEYSKKYDVEKVSAGANGASIETINYTSDNIIKADQENTLSRIFLQTHTDCICYSDCAAYYTCLCYGNCNHY